MTECVLDSSALLAFLRNEPEAADVRSRLRGSFVSAVNLAEVLRQVKRADRGIEKTRALLKNWHVGIAEFDVEQAMIAAEIDWELGDDSRTFEERACWSLGRSRQLPVVTTNVNWRTLPLELEIIVVGKEAA